MKKWLVTGILLSIFLTYVMVYAFHLDSYLTLEQLNLHRESLQAFVIARPFVAVLSYLVIYIFIVACAVPTGGLITVAGGYFFGVTAGTLYATIGATGGALAAFLMARYVLRDYIENRYATRLTKLNEALRENGVSYLLVLRLIPFMPFFLINLLVGLTRTSVARFIWTTALGIAPATLLLAFAGRELTEIHHVSDLWSGSAISALLALALLVVIPVVFQHMRPKKMA